MPIMQEIFNYSLTKNYLKNGELPDEDSTDLSFSQLQALVLRREARLAKEDG
jgi:hypothetical protein